MPMQIHLNGEPHALDAAQTITGLLLTAGLSGRKVAVEVNGEVVPRSQHESRFLSEGDRIEIIQAIGGG